MSDDEPTIDPTPPTPPKEPAAPNQPTPPSKPVPPRPDPNRDPAITGEKKTPPTQQPL